MAPVEVLGTGTEARKKIFGRRRNGARLLGQRLGLEGERVLFMAKTRIPPILNKSSVFCFPFF